MTYRTDNHQPRNLYRGDQYIGVMFDPIDAAAVVRHLNMGLGECTCDSYEPCRGECCGVGMCSCSATEEETAQAEQELGVDEDAPPSPLSAPVTAQQPPTVGQVGVDAHSGSQAITERLRAILDRWDGKTGESYDIREFSRDLHALLPREPERKADQSTPADSCTCTVAGPDPGCVVHHGRRAKGPKPPNPPGCICDGSGRACPRHGAVI